MTAWRPGRSRWRHGTRTWRRSTLRAQPRGRSISLRPLGGGSDAGLAPKYYAKIGGGAKSRFVVDGLNFSCFVHGSCAAAEKPLVLTRNVRDAREAPAVSLRVCAIWQAADCARAAIALVIITPPSGSCACSPTCAGFIGTYGRYLGMPDADPHVMILCRGGRIVSQVRVRCIRCCELAFSYCGFVIPRE